MAKWDEKDPRWLVEHREDGANVNGWHWNEMNKTEWAKATLNDLLNEIKNSDSSGNNVQAQVKSITGDASVSTRKGNKKMAIWDLCITIAWTGTTTSGGDEVKAKGEIKIEEFLCATDEDDWIWSVTCEGSGSEEDKSKLRRLAEGCKASVMAKLHEFSKLFIESTQ